MNDLVLGSLDIAAFLLCATFLAYVLMIVLSLMRHKAGPAGDPSQLAWHFFIPCLNEERVIEGTVADLFKKFPTAHLWCIDDGSIDSTPTILARLARRTARVHVVTRRPPDAHIGKGPALNAAWRALVEWLPAGTDLEGVIVGVIDADGVLDKKCPEIIAGPAFFGNPRVGAVQIMVRVVNFGSAPTSKRTRMLTRMQDLEFTTIIAGMQMLRRHVGSTSMGGNGQFTRMSALRTVSQEFGTPWERALLEDFELGLRILLTGGLTEYCHDTWVAQQGLPTVRQLMRQRSRWAQGLMQCFRYFWPVMRSREISTPAALEIGYFLVLPWVQLLGIVVYTASFGVLTYYALTTVGGVTHWFGNGAWGLIPLFVIFGIGPLMIWGPIYRRTVARGLSRRHGVVLGLLNWPYIYIHHASTIWAFGRMVRSRHDWKKTERVDLRQRQPVRPVPAAAGTGVLPRAGSRAASAGPPRSGGRVLTATTPPALAAPTTPLARALRVTPMGNNRPPPGAKRPLPGAKPAAPGRQHLSPEPRVAPAAGGRKARSPQPAVPPAAAHNVRGKLRVQAEANDHGRVPRRARGRLRAAPAERSTALAATAPVAGPPTD